MSDRLHVVYLAGTSHCGSTVLSFLFDCHPEICSVGEVPNRADAATGGQNIICSCGQALRECGFWQRAFSRIQVRGVRNPVACWANSYGYRQRLLHKVLGLHRCGWKGQLQLLADRCLPVHRRRVNDCDRVNVAFVRSVLEERGAKVFFDASKRLRRLARMLRTPEFDVKVIRVVRDARAYANSMKRHQVAVSAAARQWRNYQAAAEDLLSTIDPHRVRVVRYEDVCGAPRQHLPGLLEFMGVSPREMPLAVIPKEHHVIGNRVRLSDRLELRADERWRTALTDDEAAAVCRVVAGEHARFGYAL